MTASLKASLTSRFATVRDLMSRWGVVRSIYVLFLMQLQRRLHVNFFRLTVRPLTNTTTSSSRSSARKFKVLSEKELLEYATDPQLDMTADFIQAAISRGNICIGALERNLLVGYTWFAFDTAPHLDGLWVSFPSHARYGYKVFVRPEFRGVRVAGDINKFADSVCMELGKREGIEIIDIYNFASQRAFYRVGARTIGYVGYVRFFGRLFAFYSSSAKKYGFCFCAPALSKKNENPTHRATA